MNCTKHPDQVVSWVCLERRCEQRTMCSRCAVKQHPRDHKLEELSTIVNMGILNAYKSNPQNDTYGIQRLCMQVDMPSVPRISTEQEIMRALEESLKRVTGEMNAIREKLVYEMHTIYQMEEEQRQKVHSMIKESEDKLVNQNFQDSSQLQSLINSSFEIINDYVYKKEQDLNDQQNSELFLIQKKLHLLNAMQNRFITMITQYLENDFTHNFCQLFEMQMQTLQFEQMEIESQQSYFMQGNVSDSNGFLEFVSKKWEQDYENIDYTLKRFVIKLDEGLKYAINMPLQQDSTQQFNSPAKRQQQFQSLPTPMYVQHVVMPPQQYLISPQPMHHRDFQEHMAKSQIVYMPEEIPVKKVEVQPVCQRAQSVFTKFSLQQKDNEAPISKRPQLAGSKVENKPVDKSNMTQALNQIFNRISNATKK